MESSAQQQNRQTSEVLSSTSDDGMRHGTGGKGSAGAEARQESIQEALGFVRGDGGCFREMTYLQGCVWCVGKTQQL